jgi:hypothetical protein
MAGAADCVSGVIAGMDYAINKLASGAVFAGYLLQLLLFCLTLCFFASLLCS